MIRQNLAANLAEPPDPTLSDSPVSIIDVDSDKKASAREGHRKLSVKVSLLAATAASTPASEGVSSLSPADTPATAGDPSPLLI